MDISLAKLLGREEFGITAEQYIGTASCHVGGYGHGAAALAVLLSCKCHDVGLLLVQLGVEHLVDDGVALARLWVDVHGEHTREQL